MQIKGELNILDSYKFRIDFKESSLVFHKIISEDYKLSEQIHDDIEINKLSLKMPHELSNELWFTGYEYYLDCMHRREVWTRLERKEIKKDDALKWAEIMIKSCTNSFEVTEFEVFIGMINKIFDN